jgi:hypothetical protein
MATCIFFLSVEIFSWEISPFVSKKTLWALFGNLESPTSEAQFLVTMVVFVLSL